METIGSDNILPFRPPAAEHQASQRHVISISAALYTDAATALAEYDRLSQSLSANPENATRMSELRERVVRFLCLAPAVAAIDRE